MPISAEHFEHVPVKLASAFGEWRPVASVPIGIYEGILVEDPRPFCEIVLLVLEKVEVS